MEFILQIGAVYIVVNGLAFLYFHQRLNAQDKYISTYFKAFASNKGLDVPPNLSTIEVLNEKKPEVYSPRHDQDTIMRGGVIDPFN